MFDTLDSATPNMAGLGWWLRTMERRADDQPTTPEEYLEPEFRDRVEMPELEANSS
jgi:hypothetical protein